MDLKNHPRPNQKTTIWEAPSKIKTKLPHPHTRIERYHELRAMADEAGNDYTLRQFIGGKIFDLLSITDEQYQSRIEYEHKHFKS
ncbi:hypothetical protein TOTORO_01970 [Serratia phage vB_SmaS-Totoro]|nr:hypothetical protein TOTORO_01970 [Serratia phage vB_SmaS-Totoro]